jgi:hypothetical protein
MPEHIQTFSTLVTDAWGVRYRVHVEGERNRLGTWDGWLVFEPELGAGPTLRTGRETTQPERDDLVYWSTGLEPVYLEGAIGRARGG